MQLLTRERSVTAIDTVIRVLCVDDHAILRAGIAALISNRIDMQLVGEAENGREAIEQARLLRPDVILMDLQMPEMGGIEAISAIRTHCPAAKIVVLTTYGGDVIARRALAAGAHAYLLKGDVRTELATVIRSTFQGHREIAPPVAAELAQHVNSSGLSVREVEILKLVAAGMSNKRIAYSLAITEGTVKSHVKNILDKLDANDRTHAVTLGLQRGIFGL